MSELWSDFDGTAVGLKGKSDPRNWSKYPLPLKEGFTDFLDGAISGGIKLGGVVTRRPDIWPRRFVTHRSIAQLGLNRYFDVKDIVLAGSERAKAQYVVDRSAEARVAIIDDKPHKIGVELVEALAHSGLSSTVTLGVVQHEKTIDYVNRLRSEVDAMQEVEVDTALDGKFEIGVGASVLRVVQMMPYSVEAGLHFAERT